MSNSKVARLDARLVRGLDEQAVLEIQERYAQSRFLREKLVGVLTKQLEGAILQAESEEILDSPNALAKLADLAGYRRGLREAIRLLNIQENNP